MRITLKNGETIVRREATSTGTPERPLSREQIEAKFIALATRVTDEETARKIADTVWALDTRGSAADLARLCSLQN